MKRIKGNNATWTVFGQTDGWGRTVLQLSEGANLSQAVKAATRLESLGWKNVGYQFQVPPSSHQERLCSAAQLGIKLNVPLEHVQMLHG